MKVLGINAVFHDSAAALVADGKIVAAAEEERFSRRKHGKECNPFTTWELPALSAAWCLQEAGIDADELDAVAYSYDPALALRTNGDVTAAEWEGLRTLYVQHTEGFLRSVFPKLPRNTVRYVRHHVAHAASAYLAGPHRTCSVIVADGRGENASFLAGHVRDGNLEVLAVQHLPHSLGLRYEEATMQLGFRRSSDEYKVMGLAAYGKPVHLDYFRRKIAVNGNGGFYADGIDWDALCPKRDKDQPFKQQHADLAASLQIRLEEVLLELAQRLYDQTHDKVVVMAGGVALNCVANARLAREGPFEEVWVQPAAGDAGTALGAALYVSHAAGDRIEPMQSAALGRHFSEQQVESFLREAHVGYERPANIADAAAEIIARDGVVAWFQGKSEYGPRALGHRSLLAHPGFAANLERLNHIKGREEFRPVAPMVLNDRAATIFEGQLPSPYMLFTHRVKRDWRERIAAAVHVDGTARVQTVDRAEEPLVAEMLEAFERRTGTPVVINTSLNTAGRPMVDEPRDALECFGSAPIDAMAIGPFLFVAMA
ncbi:MAG: carbamoyltransferase [Candidatus Eremiobacteraeota bacterium]|nr:carbamoyltransferase [Candidatus Eremiobacteraeota bacterium]